MNETIIERPARDPAARASAKGRDVVKIAAGELGNTETPANSNRTKYGAWYGLDGYPWCMMFVQWCCAQAGRPLPYKTASCSQLLDWYRKYQPEQIVDRPVPGDIILYNFGHTGILESAGEETITAIEGNTSAGEAGSQSDGGGVFRRTRSRKLVTAFIRPLDAAEEDDMTGKEIYEALNDYLKAQPMPAWAEKELAEAAELGLTDGKDPMALIPRYQAAIMAKRAAEKK